VPSYGNYLRPQEQTLAETLKSAGYVTGMFGKLHIGSGQPGTACNPTGMGFDEWVIGLNYFDNDPYLSRNGVVEHRTGKGSVLVMDDAIGFLKKHRGGGKPLFMTVWLPSPHDPHAEVPDGPSLYDGKPHAGYFREITLLDQQLGRLRAALRDMNLAENTILWYCSDNGGLFEETSGGRAMKGSVYEGGLRVPSVVEWPARKLKGRSATPAVTSDLYPTLLAMAGLKPLAPHPLDGIDLSGVMAGRTAARGAGIGFWHGFGKGDLTYSDRFLKAIMEKQQAGAPPPHDPERLRKDVDDFPQYPEDIAKGHAAWNNWPWKLHRVNGDSYELYHLSDDPLETTDLSHDPAHQERLARMKRELDAWMRSVIRSLNGKDYKRPNLLIILTDDQGYGDVSAYQETVVRTPHIDRIGSEGILFTAMRANCTVCSPSRAAMLTGRYADRVGVPGVIRTQAESSWGHLTPSVPTLADELKRAGYHTSLIGKWHLGLESPNLPNERGFDFFHGFIGDMMDDYYKHGRHGQHYMRRNQQVVEPDGHATEVFTDWAIDTFRERKDAGPFFMVLAYNAPHFPIQPPKEWFEKIKQREPQLSAARARNVAFVEHLDHNIGRVLEALDATGLTENTVVVFSADNGGSLPHAQNNDPWRGGKQDHYDGGLRVPFMIRWPARVEAGARSDYPGLLFDVFPTFLELAGAAVPPGIDGVSLAPILRGEALETPGRELYFVRREGNQRYLGQAYHALVRGDWKILRNHPFQPYELYNLKDDPQEKNDQAKARPDVFNDLAIALSRHIQRGGATPWQPPAR
jgi:arylsulfatase A-like enzyme